MDAVLFDSLGFVLAAVALVVWVFLLSTFVDLKDSFSDDDTANALFRLAGLFLVLPAAIMRQCCSRLPRRRLIVPITFITRSAYGAPARARSSGLSAGQSPPRAILVAASIGFSSREIPCVSIGVSDESNGSLETYKTTSSEERKK